MESRVLSHAATFSSPPHFRKLPSREAAVFYNASAVPVTVKAIGSVADAGNLIWGRQLRPALLSPALKKESVLLPPCLASSASSPADGSDSAGWGPFPPFWLSELGRVTGLTNVLRCLFVCLFFFLQRSEGSSGRVHPKVPGSGDRVFLLHVVSHVTFTIY